MDNTLLNNLRRVAIYGRVSTEHEAQLSAFENQQAWYDDLTARHLEWSVVERYFDRGITGTAAKKRPAFLKMLADAKDGMFDLIVTREVCRFARNTVDTLSITRDLKRLGVEVYFVNDNIRTMDGDGELRLSIMATLAQEESRKISERVRAGQAVSCEKGVLSGGTNGGKTPMVQRLTVMSAIAGPGVFRRRSCDLSVWRMLSPATVTPFRAGSWT